MWAKRLAYPPLEVPHDVFHMAVTPDWSRLFTNARDDVLRIWNLQDGTMQHSTITSRGKMKATATHVLVQKENYAAELVDLSQGEVSRTFESKSCRFDLNDKFAMTLTDMDIMLWDIRVRNNVMHWNEFRHAVSSMSLFGEQWYASYSTWNGRMVCCDVRQTRPMIQLQLHPSTIWQTTYYKTVQDKVYMGTQDGTATIMDMPSGCIDKQTKVPTPGIWTFIYQDITSEYVIGNQNHTGRIAYSMDTGEELFTDNTANCMICSKDRVIVADDNIRVYDVWRRDV